MKLPINLNQVFATYSGRPGCMCGCMGKYSHPQAQRNFASKYRGYAVDDCEVSDRSVKLTVKKIQALDYSTEEHGNGVLCHFADNPVTGRVYAVYEVTSHG